MTIAFRSSGIVGTINFGAIGGSCTWRMAIATGLSPSNGTLPVNISYNTTPTE